MYLKKKENIVFIMNQERIHNFSPGPGVLFEDVLTKAQKELLNWNNSGMSILELNHRTPEFNKLLLNTKDKLRTLAKIPDSFDILFIQGGATQVFSSIPLNFCANDDTVDYIVNGYWSEFAAKEANKYVNVHISNTDNDYTRCPEQSELNILKESKYVHFCSNETIHGLEFQYVPDVGNKPLICDMSSNFLSKPIVNIEKYGMIYAGCHKNVGPAGMVIIIIRNDMLNRYRLNTPLLLNFTEIMKHNSMLNTPPVFNIYIAGMTFLKLLHLGGLYEVAKKNKKKAQLFYDVIESSNGFYSYSMTPRHKSLMNIPFMLKGKELEDRFLMEANTRGLKGLRGHITVGHCRASLYNALPMESVVKLVNFMEWFHKQNKI